MKLTDQQQAVVDHNTGPALVFAVAGAGKTTAMVRRIARLVDQGVFEANRVLATSFGKANQQDIRAALVPWPACKPVAVSTLHALGRAIVQDARERRLLPPPRRSADVAKLGQMTLNAALAEARRRNVSYLRELNGLDRQDFLDYIGRNKGNLAYADLKAQTLPRAARKLATQAEPPSEKLAWYLDLYQLFESIRRRQGWITFDDMLTTAWELMQQHDALRQAWQTRFDCVLVDEFQDINLVQSELLDLLTEPHRNFMAIGDDDQTIYEWRGAHPRYILAFPKRYSADTYLITDNFRCPASPIVLANAVIRHNQNRRPKQLNLTKGMNGSAELHTHDTVEQMAEHIVNRFVAQHKSGRPWHDMAVLVRLNAQTPHIEQQLIERDIPYRVSQPFYARFEIVTLIEYCRLAWLDQYVRSGNTLSAGQRALFEKAWSQVHNRPKRYIGRELRDSIRHAVAHQGVPVADALSLHAQRVSPYVGESLDLLADDIAWLSTQLDQPADAVLAELDDRLQFQQYLRDSSSSPQIGDGRAASVAAFILYARDKGALQQFMRAIRDLAEQRVGRNQRAADALTLSTIHQSKGLEWPVVCVPHLNQGVVPFTGMTTFNLEEERRLLYVALTRAQEQLHLDVIKPEEPSQFLVEVDIAQLLHELSRWKSLLNGAANEAPSAAECRFVAQKTRQFAMQRYFQQYATTPLPVAPAVLAWLETLSARQLKQYQLDSADVAFWRDLSNRPVTGESV